MPFERTNLYHQIESDIRPALFNEPNIVKVSNFNLKVSRDPVLRTMCYRTSQDREQCSHHKTSLLQCGSPSSESLETD